MVFFNARLIIFSFSFCYKLRLFSNRRAYSFSDLFMLLVGPEAPRYDIQGPHDRYPEAICHCKHGCNRIYLDFGHSSFFCSGGQSCPFSSRTYPALPDTRGPVGTTKPTESTTVRYGGKSVNHNS